MVRPSGGDGLDRDDSRGGRASIIRVRRRVFVRGRSPGPAGAIFVRKSRDDSPEMTHRRPGAPLPSPPVTAAAQRRELLKDLYGEASKCVRCPLHQTRTNVVFGAGNANAELMFVGEAPGANEDRLGLPFVGAAGKLLDKLLSEIGMSRGDVFICNTLKCRPPDNRDPHPLETESCQGYLHRQIELVEPASDDSPVTKFLRERGGGLHHLCYEVQDLEQALAAFKSRGAVLAKRPLPAVAFDGRRIAWIVTTEKLLIELLEADNAAAELA